jgi:hypothetical protein
LNDESIPEGMREEWHQARADRWILAPETGQYGGETMREDNP